MKIQLPAAKFLSIQVIKSLSNNSYCTDNGDRSIKRGLDERGKGGNVFSFIHAEGGNMAAEQSNPQTISQAYKHKQK